MASSSVNREDTFKLGHGLTMLQSIGQHTERQGLGPRDRFVAAAAIGKHSRKIHNLSEPATILFALNLYREVTHNEMLQRFEPCILYRATSVPR
jgi:hypothetical protein